MATKLTNTGVVFPDDTVQTTAATSAGGTFEAVASGSLSDGSTVIVNSDGTVSVISTTTIDPPTAGTPVVFEAAITYTISAIYDPDQQKVVIAYQDRGNSFYGTAILGTVSGTSISFGTAVVFESASSSQISIGYDTNQQKAVIAYRDEGNSNYGTAIVGTASGTSISFGTAVVFESATTNYTSVTYDSNQQKVVIAYRDDGNSRYGTAVVGTVSGTSISFGTAVVFEAAESNWISTVYDSTNQKVVIAYQDDGNLQYGTAIVGTVSGTSISFGTPAVFESATIGLLSIVYDTNQQKVVITYQDIGNSVYGTAVVGTISGTSVSFGTPVVFESASTSYLSATYDSNTQKVVIAYRDNGNSNYGTAIVGTVSGTSISFGTPVVFESAETNYSSTIYDSNQQKVVIAYQDVGNSENGTAVVLTTSSTNLTAENFIGISDGAYSDSETATVLIAGSVSDAQSGLTAGQTYYVQTDGTLGTTPSDPSVYAGTAIAATKLIVQG